MARNTARREGAFPAIGGLGGLLRVETVDGVTHVGNIVAGVDPAPRTTEHPGPGLIRGQYQQVDKPKGGE